MNRRILSIALFAEFLSDLDKLIFSTPIKSSWPNISKHDIPYKPKINQNRNYQEHNYFMNKRLYNRRN